MERNAHSVNRNEYVAYELGIKYNHLVNVLKAICMNTYYSNVSL